MALKIGTEDKKKVALVAVLSVVLVWLAVQTILKYFGGPDTPPAPVAAAPAPVATPAAHTGATQRASADTPSHGPLGLDIDPSLHPEIMAAAEELVYTGKGRNIFSLTSTPVIERPKAPARPDPAAMAAAQAAANTPPPPPPPPPIELKYFGFTSTHRGLRKAYLLHDDDIFVAVEGDVVNRRYKVGKITSTTVQITDIPFNNTQTLHLLVN